MFAKFVRSPLLGLFTWWYVIGIFHIAFFSSYELSEELKQLLTFVVFFAPVLILLIPYLYNRKHPEDRISLKRVFLPWEFHEIDEGQKWITYNACRNVYIYYSFALPISIVLYTFFRNTSYTPILLIGLLGTGQYLVYWITIKKLNRPIVE